MCSRRYAPGDAVVSGTRDPIRFGGRSVRGYPGQGTFSQHCTTGTPPRSARNGARTARQVAPHHRIGLVPPDLRRLRSAAGTGRVTAG